MKTSAFLSPPIALPSLSSSLASVLAVYLQKYPNGATRAKALCSHPNDNTRAVIATANKCAWLPVVVPASVNNGSTSNTKIHIKLVLKTQEAAFSPLQARSQCSTVALAERRKKTLGDFAASHCNPGIWGDSWEGSGAQGQRCFGPICFSLAMPPTQSHLQGA